jgi:hypothetical protein
MDELGLTKEDQCNLTSYTELSRFHFGGPSKDASPYLGTVVRTEYVLTLKRITGLSPSSRGSALD